MGDTRVLIVEDTPELADLIARTLRDDGFTAECALSGAVAFQKLQARWDLIILDLSLPDLDGVEIQDYLSSKADPTPVLVLSARNSLADKVTLFERGCDDYLVKPFELSELMVRVHALLKRSTRSSSETKYEDLSLLSETCELKAGEQRVLLTPKEFALCRFLISRPGEVVSRLKILHSVWGLSHEPNTNYIDVHLVNLRKKLNAVGRGAWLKTFRGIGIALRNPEKEYGS